MNEILILRVITAGLVGGGAGYLYFKLVGCKTGTCPITSSPLRSSLYGAFIGILFSLGGSNV